MIEPETKKILDDMEKRLRRTEELSAKKDHRHNGLDMSRVRIQDLEQIFFKQAVINPGSLADGVGETQTVTGVSGATLGDFVLVSPPYDLVGVTVTAWVSANDTVKIRLQNETTGTVDLASGTWRILVIRKII